MKRKLIFLLPLATILCFASHVKSEEERSFLENFLTPFRIFRKNIFNQIDVGKQRSSLLSRNNKLQPQIPKGVPFPCDLKNPRSLKRPTSVHKLRPGDIDVIGALGDSLIAGVGATASNVFEVAIEERGKSFCAGGEATWREYFTLPNVLKLYNPNLIGYSYNTSLTIEPGSQFNVAESGALSSNVPYMTKELIRRIKADKRVNLKKDWKMITIFIGTNDFCSDVCYVNDPEKLPERHRKDMLRVLRMLRDHLPRTIVNIIPLANRHFVLRPTIWPWCDYMKLIECSCLSGSRYKHRLDYFQELINEWQKVDIEVSENSEFDLEDFTVVVQPFFLNYTFPTPSMKDDLDSYLSFDCFHWSQRMNAKVANDLWNNLMEPVGSKSPDGSELFEKFNCPSANHPYIYTRRNSKTLKLMMSPKS